MSEKGGNSPAAASSHRSSKGGISISPAGSTHRSSTLSRAEEYLRDRQARREEDAASGSGGSGSGRQSPQVSARSGSGRAPPSPAKSGTPSSQRLSRSGSRQGGVLALISTGKSITSGSGHNTPGRPGSGHFTPGRVTPKESLLLPQHHLGLMGAVQNAPSRMCAHSPLSIAVPVWRDSRFPEWERHVSYGTNEIFWFNWYNGQISFQDPAEKARRRALRKLKGGPRGEKDSRSGTGSESGGSGGGSGSGSSVRRQPGAPLEDEPGVPVGPHAASLRRAQDTRNPADHSSYFEERWQESESESDKENEDEDHGEIHDMKKAHWQKDREGPSYEAKNWIYENGVWINEETGQTRANNRPNFLGHVWLHQ